MLTSQYVCSVSYLSGSVSVRRACRILMDSTVSPRHVVGQHGKNQWMLQPLALHVDHTREHQPSATTTASPTPTWVRQSGKCCVSVCCLRVGHTMLSALLVIWFMKQCAVSCIGQLCMHTFMQCHVATCGCPPALLPSLHGRLHSRYCAPGSAQLLCPPCSTV